MRPIAALLVVAATALVLRAGGSIHDTAMALELMGFDPDRAELLTALTVEALAIAGAVVITRSPLAASIGGMAVAAAVYQRTFRTETEQALRATGAQGAFDPVGWVVTVVTLVSAAVIVAWAVSALALIVRRALLTAGGDLAALRAGSRDRGQLARPVSVVAVAVLLAITVPVFGDLVNYTPDVHMLDGAGASPGLTDVSRLAAASAGDPSTPPDVADRPVVVPGTRPSPGASTPPPVLSSSSPWTAWVPSGSGSMVTTTLPGPWPDGQTKQSSVAVYTPPGYATSSQRYPVVYEVPWGATGGWTTAVHLPSLLDSLIDSGRFPASIVVFVNGTGGVFPDGECADSADGRQHVERYITDTVVPMIDRQYRTIATPAARAVLGFSQGGFCAAMLVLRDPGTFSEALVASGYFQAGMRSSETPNAWRVFGGDPALEAAYSPLDLARHVAAADRAHEFVELSANPSEPIYGPQYQAFAAALHDGGIDAVLLPTSGGHSWSTVRTIAPELLTTLGRRWAEQGVFG